MALITIDRNIIAEISDHPKLKWEDNAVKRKVRFIQFNRYDPTAGIISLDLELELLYNIDNSKKKVINYILSNDVYLNVATTQIAKKTITNEDLTTYEVIINDPLELPEENNYMSEVDYWFNLMANEAIPNKYLIQQAILNLDNNQKYFDNII